MKLFIAIFFLVSGFAYGQTNFRAVMVDSNQVVQRPTNFFSVNRILTFDTNGNVVYTNTNVLSFTKGVEIKGLDTTNIPTLYWETSDGVGDGSMLSFSRRHATNLWFGINQTNWSQGVWGQNIVPTADGNDFTRKNTNIGAVAIVLENEYNFESNTNNPDRNVAEMYFKVYSQDGTQFRPFMFVGSQTNPVLGYGGSYYPFTVQTTNLGFNATHALTVDFANPAAGSTMQIRNMATNSGTYAQLEFINSASTTAFFAKQNKFDIYANHSPSWIILQGNTNGVIIGGTLSSSAAARIQLGGDTRIDGAISFNNTTNAATTRTNLELGGGVTTNITFVDAATNTNTVSISNGIITGWTR